MKATAGEARTKSQVMFSFGLLHIDASVLTNQQELMYISSVQTLDVIWTTCRERDG